LTEGERTELYLLYRHLGIEPEDALHRRPEWVVDLLSDGLAIELGAGGDEGADPESLLTELDLDVEPEGPPLPAGLEGLL
jgi:hypothetical protein